MVIAVRAHCNPLDIYIYINSFKVGLLYQIQEVMSSNPGDTGQTVGFSFE